MRRITKRLLAASHIRKNLVLNLLKIDVHVGSPWIGYTSASKGNPKNKTTYSLSTERKMQCMNKSDEKMKWMEITTEKKKGVNML